MFEVMLGDPRSWGDRPEAFEGVLAAHGAEPLPDVELDSRVAPGPARSLADVRGK